MDIKSTFSKKKLLTGENIDLVKSTVEHSSGLYQQIKSQLYNVGKPQESGMEIMCVFIKWLTT